MNEAFGFVRTAYEFISGLEEPWNWIVGLGSIFIVIGVLLWRMLKFVKRDKVAIRERLGKPILKYRPLPGERKLSKEERKRRITIDKKLIEYQENPIYGEEVVHGSGPVIINPFTHRLEEVESRERNFVIADFPVVVNRENWDGDKLYLAATVSMRKAYRWRYRNEAVDDLIIQILMSHLNAIREEKGAEWIRENSTEFIEHFLKVLQTKTPQSTRFSESEKELEELLEKFVKNDPLQGALAKYGGYVTRVYLTKVEPIYEGWQPQATLKVAEAIQAKTGLEELSEALLDPAKADLAIPAASVTVLKTAQQR